MPLNPYNNLGSAKLLKGDINGAIAYYNEAIRLFECHTEMLLSKCLVLV
jgi:hypothetical protein